MFTDFVREKNTMIAKMNVLLNKAVYEKSRAVDSTSKSIVPETEEQVDAHAGDDIKKALLDSLVSGKVGSLSVDPNYLDFEALECKLTYSILID